MEMLDRVCYWLIPTQETRAIWKSVIANFAEKYSGPAFEPHVTLYVTRAGSEDVEALTKQALEKIGTISLTVQDIDFSDNFTTACYLQFAPSSLLGEVSALLRDQSEIKEPYQLKPHMSLYYGHMNEHQRKEIREAITIPTEISFDSVWAIAAGSQTASTNDVLAWKYLYQPGTSP